MSKHQPEAPLVSGPALYCDARWPIRWSVVHLAVRREGMSRFSAVRSLSWARIADVESMVSQMLHYLQLDGNEAASTRSVLGRLRGPVGGQGVILSYDLFESWASPARFTWPSESTALVVYQAYIMPFRHGAVAVIDTVAPLTADAIVVDGVPTASSTRTGKLNMSFEQLTKESLEESNTIAIASKRRWRATEPVLVVLTRTVKKRTEQHRVVLTNCRSTISRFYLGSSTATVEVFTAQGKELSWTFGPKVISTISVTLGAEELNSLKFIWS